MKRSELFEAVWAQPMTKLAASLGISDRGLSNICQRFDVPTPPRGYWRQLQTGQKLERAVLPDPQKDFEVPLSLKGLPKKVKTVGPSMASSQPEDVSAKLEPNSVETKTSVPTAEPPVGPALCTESYQAVAEEFEWAVRLTEDIRTRQMMNDLLAQLLFRARSEDPATFRAVGAWVEAIQIKMNQTDSIARCIARIRSSVQDRKKPLWWPALRVTN